MPTYTPIYSRSPKFINVNGTAGQDTKVELYIWNDPDSEPSNPTHVLSKPIPSSVVVDADYDISPYIREYITHLSYTEITSDTAATVGEYCRCRMSSYLDEVLVTTSYFICFNGYGYFEDGYNPLLTATTTPPHMTPGTYLVRDTGGHGAIGYNDDLVVTWEATYTGTVSGGTTTITLANEAGLIPYVHNNYLTQGNTVEVKRNSTVVGTYVFEIVCESKYTPIDCDFVNRYGRWQRLVFFKANKKEMTMTNEMFKMMPADIDYDITANINQSFNTNAQESITCNTGWVAEEYSEVIKELLLSQTIRLDGEPVVLMTKNVTLMTHLNDKTINYEVKFDYANSMLNYIT